MLQLADKFAIDELDHTSAGDGDAKEPLEMVEAARVQWDTRLRYQLRSMAAQTKRPLVQRRTQQGEKNVTYDLLRLGDAVHCIELMVTLQNRKHSQLDWSTRGVNC